MQFYVENGFFFLVFRIPKDEVSVSLFISWARPSYKDSKILMQNAVAREFPPCTFFWRLTLPQGLSFGRGTSSSYRIDFFLNQIGTVRQCTYLEAFAEPLLIT